MITPPGMARCAAAVAWATAAGPALACTLCRSDAAEAFRQRLADDSWWNGMLVVLPLAVLAGIVALAAREPDALED